MPVKTLKQHIKSKFSTSERNIFQKQNIEYVSSDAKRRFTHLHVITPWNMHPTDTRYREAQFVA